LDYKHLTRLFAEVRFNFTDTTGDIGAGMQRTTFRVSDDKLRLIEHFTRVDPETILYEFTVDDSTAFTNSWTAQIPSMVRTSGPLFEYARHEGNYADEVCPRRGPSSRKEKRRRRCNIKIRQAISLASLQERGRRRP
jgi:hypothetical protein